MQLKTNVSENGPDFYNWLDRFWSRFGDPFGVQSGPKSVPKIGPKMDPEKVDPGGFPPAGKGLGRGLFPKNAGSGGV